jgi:hypothetical protein
LRESLHSLTRGFTAVAKDKTPINQTNSKKLAIFAVTNVLFKVYFKVNTLQLCGKLINVVEGSGSGKLIYLPIINSCKFSIFFFFLTICKGGIMDNLKYFPVSDVTMYKYYIGRLKMFEDRYEEARLIFNFFFF